MRNDLLDKYSASLPEGSRTMLTARARKYLQWLDDREPDAGSVREWMERLKKEKYSDQTMLCDWSAIRRMYVVNGLAWPFHRGDAPVVQEEGVFAPALDPADIKSMVYVAIGWDRPKGLLKPDERHTAFLCLSTIWGLRRIEMAQMRPSNIDKKNRRLFVATAKHGRQRYHYMPDEIRPNLGVWGFERPMSIFQLSKLFVELRGMIGFTGPQAQDVGWHSIRRAGIKAAFASGFNEAEVHSYYRWKRSTRNMAMRYATSLTVGTATQDTGMVQGEDRELDERMYASHPFYKFWTELS